MADGLFGYGTTPARSCGCINRGGGTLPLAMVVTGAVPFGEGTLGALSDPSVGYYRVQPPIFNSKVS
jgi:hypothetical protein